MKLLFVSEVYTPWQGGSIVAIRNLMRQLVEKGNEVTIITGEKRKNWRLWGIRIEKDEECKVNVYRIPAIPYPFNTMATMTLPDYAGIKKIISKEKPDCIHLFSPVGIAEKIVLRYAKHFRIPVVVTNHIMPENFTLNVKLPTALQNLADKIIYQDLIRFCNQANFVTAPTTTAIELLREHGLRTKHEAVTNGVDVDYFNPGNPDGVELSRFRLDKNDLHILYVGRLDGEKRVDLLVEAMPFILSKIPHAKLLIAGKGLQRINLNEEVNTLNEKNAVRFLGKVTEEEKRALLQSSDVFTIASPSELQCIAALEALSCGLPVVAADQMALKELIDGGKNGLLFRYPDTADLAVKICQLLDDAKKRIELGKNGRVWIVKNHQLSQVGDRYLEIYKLVITK